MSKARCIQYTVYSMYLESQIRFYLINIENVKILSLNFSTD